MKALMFSLLLIMATTMYAAPVVGFEKHNLHCAYDVGDEFQTNVISLYNISILSPQLVVPVADAPDFQTLDILSEYGLVRCSYIGNFNSNITTNANAFSADYILPMVIPLVAVYYGVIEPIQNFAEYLSTYSKASSC